MWPIIVFAALSADAPALPVRDADDVEVPFERLTTKNSLGRTIIGCFEGWHYYSHQWLTAFNSHLCQPATCT